MYEWRSGASDGPGNLSDGEWASVPETLAGEIIELDAGCQPERRGLCEEATKGAVLPLGLRLSTLVPERKSFIRGQ